MLNKAALATFARLATALTLALTSAPDVDPSDPSTLAWVKGQLEGKAEAVHANAAARAAQALGAVRG